MAQSLSELATRNRSEVADRHTSRRRTRLRRAGLMGVPCHTRATHSGTRRFFVVNEVHRRVIGETVSELGIQYQFEVGAAGLEPTTSAV
jgi:hypothetical protein